MMEEKGRERKIWGDERESEKDSGGRKGPTMARNGAETF